MLKTIKDEINFTQYQKNHYEFKVNQLISIACKYFQVPYSSIEIISESSVEVVYINANLKELNGKHIIHLEDNPLALILRTDELLYNVQPSLFLSDTTYNSNIIKFNISYKTSIDKNKFIIFHLFDFKANNRELESDDQEVVEAIAHSLISHIAKITNKDCIEEYNILKTNQEITKVGYWNLNLKTKEIIWSPEVYNMCGRSQALPPPFIDDYYENIYLEDRNIVKEAIQATIDEGKSYHVTVRVIKEDTKEIRFHDSKGELIKDAQGNPTNLIGTVVDISNFFMAQRKIEHSYTLFKNIINSIGVPIAVRDSSFRFILVNEAYCDLFLVDPQDIIGKTLYEMNFDNKAFVETDSEVLKNENNIIFESIWTNPINNKQHNLIINKVCMKHEGQNLIMASAKDITETKENILLREQKIKSEIAINVKSEFVAHISHEIRNPLNALIGASDLLSENISLNPDEVDYLNIIKDSSNVMLNLINEILDFAKIESGKVEICNNKFDLYAEIISIINLAKIEVKKKNLDIILDYNLAAVPTIVIGDQNKVAQIIRNLVNNAIKFTEKGYVRIKVSNIDNQFLISVKDSGIGIKDTQQESIFDQFTQANNEITKKYGGTGLGLSICLKLAKLMNGSLSLHSIVDEGSEFNLKIKFGLTAMDMFINNNITDDNITTSNRPKILLVEDNVNNQFIISHMLKKLDLSIEKAENGSEAIELLKKISVDLILMDCQMPIMDGYNASMIIKEMMWRKEINNIPIIAITAYASKEDKEKCLEYGMSDYLAKPIYFRDLASKLEKWLSKKNTITFV